MSDAFATYQWVVIGAGPAGIAAVGQLLEQGVESKQIAWVDPEFKVGDFGTRWCKVSSNTRVELFLKFLFECAAFEYAAVAKEFAISQLDPSKTCQLALAAEPLQWVTNKLKTQVQAVTAKVKQLKLHDRHWILDLANTNIRAKNVVLATGAEPKSLQFPGISEISLVTALDPDQLNTACDINDVIAVFGSSHSAIIILKTLIEQCRINKVINFYLSPLRYATYFDDWIVFDDTGLKGTTAEWARENIDGRLPKQLQRIIANEENIQLNLPLCTKAIYATGFQKRLIPVNGMHTLEYNDRSGIIAPGLFGFGIAFPEAKCDRFGTLEYRVGLWKFMEYIKRVMPVWLKYSA